MVLRDQTMLVDSYRNAETLLDRNMDCLHGQNTYQNKNSYWDLDYEDTSRSYETRQHQTTSMNIMANCRITSKTRCC